jgi:hypothetical protein
MYILRLQTCAVVLSLGRTMAQTHLGAYLLPNLSYSSYSYSFDQEPSQANGAHFMSLMLWAIMLATPVPQAPTDGRTDLEKGLMPSFSPTTCPPADEGKVFASMYTPYSKPY